MTSTSAPASVTHVEPSSVLYRSLSSALCLACLRTHGQELTARAELEIGHREHERFLTEIGASRDDRPPSSGPSGCADVHAATDASLRGRPATTITDDGRAWLLYRPPHWMGPAPGGPSAAVAALDGSVTRAWFRARHGLTAARVGGPGVQFVHTHDMAAGDPFDAGFFAHGTDSRAAADPYVRRHDVDPPRFEEAAGGGVPGVTWDPVRGCALRMTVLTELLGEVGGAAVIGHAWRVVLGAYIQWLPHALGLPAPTTPEDAARLYRATAAVASDLERRGDHVLVHHETRGWDEFGSAPRHTVEAIVGAWAAVLPNHRWKLHAELQPTHLTGSEQVTVRFDLTGPRG